MEVKWPAHDYAKLSLSVAMLNRAKKAGRRFPWRGIHIHNHEVWFWPPINDKKRDMPPRKLISHDEIAYWFKYGKKMPPQLPPILPTIS